MDFLRLPEESKRFIDSSFEIIIAVRSGNMEKVERLITKDFDVEYKHDGERTLFHTAMDNSQLKVAEFLLKERKANINTKDNYGSVPLYNSIGKDTSEELLFLIENGADVNIKNNEGKTPLYLAVRWGKFEAVKVLIEHGAIIDDSAKEAMEGMIFGDHSKEIVEFLDNCEKYPIDVKPAVED